MTPAAEGIIASIDPAEVAPTSGALPGWKVMVGTGGVQLASLTGTLALLERPGSVPIYCAFDGRLDARDELVAALGVRVDGEGIQDALLVAMAYERWGVDSASRLIGDFVLTLWDAREEQLWVVRDPVGVKQVFYDEGPTRTVASDLRTFDLRSAAPNMDWVRALLDNPSEQSPSETAYRGIRRLPAAHYLIVKRGQAAIVRRYRSIGEGRVPTFGSASANAEHLREVLDRGVHDRLRVGVNTAVLVSGGLDSTAVACLAVRRRPAASPPLTFVSLMFSRTPESDERHWQDLVWNYCGRPRRVIVEGDGCESFGELASGRPLVVIEPCRTPNRRLTDLPLSAARQAGCDVVVGGLWADQVFHSWFYRDLRAWLGLPFRRQLTEWPWFVPHASTHVRSALTGAARLFSTQHHARGVRGAALSSVAARVAGPVGGAQLAALDFLARRHRLTFSHPFLDVRLLDFASQLQPEWLIKRGHNKAVLRQSMAGVVPDVVRRRLSRTVVTGLVMAGPARHRMSLYALLRGGWLVQTGLLRDDTAVETLVAPRSAQDLRRLSAAVSVELWRQHLCSNSAN